MPSPDPARPPVAARAAVLAVAYTAAGLAALWASADGASAAFWPAAGVAVGGLVRWGLRAWPGVAAGAAAVGLVVGCPPVAVGAVVVGQTAGAVAGAWLIARWGGGRRPAERLSGVAGLLVGGAAVGALLDTAGGVGGRWAAGQVPAAGVAAAAGEWWIGDLVGVLLAAPALVVRWRGAVARGGGGRASLLVGAAAVVGLGAAVYAAPGLPGWLIVLAPCLPAAVWAAGRFGPPGAAAGNLLTAAVVAGLIAFDAPGDDRLAVALFAAVVGLTALCLGAAAAERDAALGASAADRERFRALLAHSHDVVGILGADGRAAFLNEAAARLTGYPYHRLAGHDPFANVHPDDRAAGRDALARCHAAGGDPVTVELRFGRADGSWAWFEVIATDQRANPAVGGVVFNARDVTARRAAEAQNAETQARYRALVENAPVAIWEEDLTAVGDWFDRLRAAGVTDLRAYLAARPDELAAAVRLVRVVDVNRAAVEMNAARDKGELMANLPRLFTPAALAAFADALAALWAGRRSHRADTRALRLDGTPVDVVLDLSVPDAGGRPDLARAVVISLDVTDRARAEAEARQAAKLDAVGRLAGGIAHDFNNLLTVITGFGEMLAPAVPQGGWEREAVDRIAAAADRAAALTRQLLAFGRRHPAHPVPLDLSAVVRTLDGAVGRAAGAGVRVAYRLADGLPVVRADPGQVEQVVAILCRNAAEAMPAGGTLTVSTEAADGGGDLPAGGWVVLAVADTGAGVPDHVRTHLFEPFFTTKQFGDGSGLGLATVHGIATQAGGHVRVESAAGRGATFRVYWPASGSVVGPARTPPPGGPTPPPAPAPESAAAPAPAARVRVLLAEDEPAIRALSTQVLAAAGFEVTAAESGAEALARLAALPAPPAVLVTDVVMPGMDGRELADRVRAIDPGVKVVFVSGYTPDEVLPAPAGAGEVFLPKPFTPDQLVRTVRQILGGG